MTLVFVDCEAWGGAPRFGVLTEFGAVEYKSRQTFHGLIYRTAPDPANPAIPLKPTAEQLFESPQYVFSKFHLWLKQFKPPYKMVSDNPAYDFQWINDGFLLLGLSPFGHSARRIGDFYAGLRGDFYCSQDWKKLRVTPHDHNPVNDAMGNAEAFERILKGEWQ